MIPGRRVIGLNERAPGGDIRVSFEFFPPKSETMEAKLWSCVKRLEPLQPDFVSVTYGAGGSTRERTHATVSRIASETTLKPAAHLTCVDATKDDVNAVIRTYADAGVEHIVALRGDPADGVGARYQPHNEGYQTTAALVAAIKERGDFQVSVSAYPEKHPESPDFQADLDVLKAKVDAGADRAITQFFFLNDLYFRYLDRVRDSGVEVPIVPGILPILNYKQAKAFSERCGTHVPAELGLQFEGLDDDPATRTVVAAMIAIEQVQDLYQRGVRDFHFYTMNRADLVFAICHLLGIRPAAETASKAAA